MREGYLWFDGNQDRDLEQKIERAAQYYLAKHGTRPNLCFVHPIMLLGSPATLDDIEIRATNSVLPNHFWLGVLEKSDRKQSK